MAIIYMLHHALIRTSRHAQIHSETGCKDIY